jgi:hypothetical protein
MVAAALSAPAAVRIFQGWVVSALAAGAAFATTGDIVASFPAPQNYPIALAVSAGSPQYLWVYCNTGPYRIWQLNAATGAVISSYASPWTSRTRGLSYSYGGGGGLPQGEYLWVGDFSTDYIYRCNPSNGSVYASFPANHDMHGGLAVMATGDGGYAPTYLWSTDNSPAYTWRQSLTSGSIYGSFATPGCYDIAWDWRWDYVWHREGTAIYGRRTSGSIMCSFAFPYGPALGFAYSSHYLWLGSTTDYHRIYKVHCPGWVPPVRPSSVGRVKAIFR